jgi:hypothetical protein
VASAIRSVSASWLRLAINRWWLLPLGGATVAVALALLLAHEAGFPLDDAWIHQDFARTLATTGQFAFQPGRGGAGSTSPVWVLLLVPPHLLTGGHAPLWLLVGWSALLGGASLAGLGIVSGHLAAQLARHAGGHERVVRLAAVLAGLAVVSEWHLVWAAASGMETDLFCLLALLLILGASRGLRPLWLGLLAAAVVATRPEGTLIAALVVVGSAWGFAAEDAEEKRGNEKVSETPTPSVSSVFSISCAVQSFLSGEFLQWSRTWLLPFAAGALVGIAPYIALNLVASGHALPSTLYAKASYYGPANLLAALADYAGQIAIIMVASSPILLAVVLLSVSRSLVNQQPRHARAALAAAPTARFRIGLLALSPTRDPIQQSRDHRPARTGDSRLDLKGASAFPLRTLLWLWPAALVLGYAGHLTELVHHGRYLMPALPPLLALGAVGAAPLLLDGRRLWSLAGGFILAAASLFSLVRGAQIYADNVHFIDGCQVNSALWLQMHTRPGALIATHDIGAIAYFSGRPVLDMAGLVDPQVVPLLPDQSALEAYLARRRAAYVVMFTDWFPPPHVLARDLAGREVYRAPGARTFVVYRTDW